MRWFDDDFVLQNFTRKYKFFPSLHSYHVNEFFNQTLQSLIMDPWHKVSKSIAITEKLLTREFLRPLNRTSCDIAPLIHNLCVLYRLGSAQHLWTVDASTLQQMKNCDVGQAFESPIFEIEGLSWQFEAYPNAEDEQGAGGFDLFIKLVHIPSSWKNIVCCIKIQCLETMTEYSNACVFSKGEAFAWPVNSMLFSEIESLDSLSFSIEIEMHKIILDECDRVFYEQNIVATNQAVEWKIDRERLQTLKTAHDGKRVWSNIYGEIYNASLLREGSNILFFLNLIALPTDQRYLRLSWTSEMIANGNDIEKTDIKSGSQGFKENEVEHNALLNKHKLSLSELMQCDSLIFKFNVKSHGEEDDAKDQMIMEYWSGMARHQHEDERKENVVKSNNLESEAAEILTIINKLREDMNQMMVNQEDLRKELKELRQNQLHAVGRTHNSVRGDEKLKNIHEERNQREADVDGGRLKEWIENEVKLPQYFDLLMENGFEDMESMKDITMEHLQEIGISKLGHRVKFMKAVTTLKTADTLLQNKFIYILAIIAILSSWWGAFVR